MPQQDRDSRYVSRGGEKLAHALDTFGIDPSELVCADFGSHVGGFIDCLLQHGASKVFSVDTSYGTLAWKLRKDSRVVVLERTNAMHVELPERVDLLTIDVGWTRQEKILPAAANALKETGSVVSLVKPHYEVEKSELDGGVLPEGEVDRVLENVLSKVREMGWEVAGVCESPIRGHGGNRESLAHLRRRRA